MELYTGVSAWEAAEPGAPESQNLCPEPGTQVPTPDIPALQRSSSQSPTQKAGLSFSAEPVKQIKIHPQIIERYLYA